jgi:hypothetical protein
MPQNGTNILDTTFGDAQGLIESMRLGTGFTFSGDRTNLTVNAVGTGGTGDVVGPAVSVNNDIALFSGITGKLIKDSGVLISSLLTANTPLTAGTVPKAFSASSLEDSILSEAAGVQKWHFTVDRNLYFSEGSDIFSFSFANDANNANVGAFKISVADYFHVNMFSSSSFAIRWDVSAGKLRLNAIDTANTTNEPLEIRCSTLLFSQQTRQTYTVTNPTTDRALNVTGDTLPQGLAVLGTLIADLQTYGLLG